MSKARKKITLTPERLRNRDELVALIEKGYDAVDRLNAAYAEINDAYERVEQSFRKAYGEEREAFVRFVKQEADFGFHHGQLWVVPDEGKPIPLRNAPAWARIGAADLLEELEAKLKELP